MNLKKGAMEGLGKGHSQDNKEKINSVSRGEVGETHREDSEL